MNYKMVLYTLGKILRIVGILLFLPLIVSVIYLDGQYLPFIICILICFVLGFALSFRKPKNQALFAREGLMITGLSWIIISLVGCLPFFISRQIPHFIDAFFETVSGFTTTGATILEDVEKLSKSMLFWRSFTHWIGGMGVLVFVLAFLPSEGQNIHLLKAESPGPKVGKLVSKVKFTARILYIIYGAMTLIQIIMLLCGGMPIFDSICISFATAGTGGFGITNAGIGGYSLYSQIVIGVFMILFGVNFNIYYLLLMKHFKQAFKSEELHWYFGIIFIAISLITTNICLVNKITSFGEFGLILKDSFFQVGSIITTTGFATTDFTLWPQFSQIILFILMFIGASAGSTGGGIKVCRFAILFKAIKRNVKKLIHPHSVSSVRFEGQKVEEDVVTGVEAYISVMFVFFLIASLIVSLDNFSFTTSITAVATCLNNIGPGLSNQIGPYGNFGDFSVLSKLTLILSMLIGRLEIYPIIALFTPTIWVKK